MPKLTNIRRYQLELSAEELKFVYAAIVQCVKTTHEEQVISNGLTQELEHQCNRSELGLDPV